MFLFTEDAQQTLPDPGYLRLAELLAYEPRAVHI